ncbi:EthD family reductase [Dietzia cercidiphylli]|uniref:EthD family reductase n=1 Tax=Dietzia natronolimnaea TaxID=161920 RepID=A0A2A2WQA7_9ACTN|nr:MULTISPECIES: EthD family reductase [Dietzia]EYT58767.1 ethyl tert-butyl ether degradation protein EthD [Dietzia sp. UCD-THP]PAY23223.1 EthD family reductase [Dietzia natronolimnaea]
MITLTVLYATPDDVEKFDEHYFGTHIPLARAVPGLEDTKVTRFFPGPDGSAPGFHLMAQLSFADSEAMGTAMSTEEGRALAADVANLGVTPTMLVGSTE